MEFKREMASVGIDAKPRLGECNSAIQRSVAKPGEAQPKG
jgi:hypothetical protein